MFHSIFQNTLRHGAQHRPPLGLDALLRLLGVHLLFGVQLLFGVRLLFGMQLLVGLLAGIGGELLHAAPQAGDRRVTVSDTTSANRWTGSLQSIADGLVQVGEGENTKSIPLVNMRQLRFEASVSAATPEQVVTLADGSSLSVVSLSIDQDAAPKIVVAGGAPQVELGPNQLVDIRFKKLSGPQQSQWEAMGQSRLSADMLVLIRSEEVLDKIEGLVTSITPEVVNFDFGGQEVPAPISKLAGVRFFSSREREFSKLAAIVHDVHGGSWQVSQLQLPLASDAVQLTLRGGVQLSLPLSAIHEIDFSVGSLKYLSELETVARTTQSRFPLAVAVPGSEQLFGANAQASEVASSDLRFLGGGTMTYRIPADFTRLVGSVELTPAGNKTTPCVVQILIEKKVLWEQRLEELQQRIPFDIPVATDERVQLSVQAESLLPVGDVVVFRDVRLMK